MKKIHIVSCSPRSGTTLLQELMTTCFRIDGYCEHEKSIFRAHQLSGEVVCTKSPLEVPYVAGLLRLDPALSVIYLLRDPRSVVCSRHGKARDSYFSNLQVWQEFEAHRLALEGHPRFLTVRYEDLVSHPDREQERIRKFLPFLEQVHQFSQFHLHAKPSADTHTALNGLRPISADGLDRWRQELPRLKAQINRHGSISAALIRAGYETDSAWEQLLEGVAPGDAASVMDADFTSGHSAKMRYRVLRKLFAYAAGRWWRKLSGRAAA